MLLRLLRAAFQNRAPSSALVQRALALRGEGRNSDAESVLRAAVKAHPNDAVAATNLAVALLEQDQVEEAVGLLERAIACDPRCAAAHFNYANVLRVSGRLAEAIAHYAAAKAADHRFAAAPEELMHTLLEACDWDRAEAIAQELRDRAARESASEWMRFVSPLTAWYLGLAPEQCLEVAAFHAPPALAAAPTRESVALRNPDHRIRIAYFSRDFRDHPVGHVLQGMFGLHDRGRFETYAFSFGPDDQSTYRRIIQDSVEHFVDVSRLSDEAAAAAISQAQVDILVDLMGHTTGNRLGVLARRPAPIQAHYLGYAGTTGAPYVDYFVSDRVVTPPRLENAFTETVAHVPDCFMVSDGSESRRATGCSRREQHLPENGYVFCNFGNPSRITRETFGLWMSILQAAPIGVLWLKRSHALVVENLRRAAHNCGIDPQRLHFAERVPDKAAHYGRLALGDLALDTIGWHNGHSTTADMLWAGVPVLTTPGATFASRVASSLIGAAGIGELITRDPQGYLSAAVRLADDRSATAALRTRFSACRASAPFFDTPRLVRGLETAYERMYADKIGRLRGSVAQSVRAGDS